MKTITQIVLPILALAGLVFGITYITNYSGGPAENKDEHRKAIVAVDPLKFGVTLGRRDSSEPHLRYWRNNYEVSENGYFDFWFRNVHDQPVRLAFLKASCQCAGADLGLVPAPAWDDYLKTSALVGMPLPGMPLIAALNTAAMANSIAYTKLGEKGKKLEATVPAAGPGGPQWGFVRLNWDARDPEGDRKIDAELLTQLPGAPASPVRLEAQFNVVPPFDIYSPSSGQRTVKVGELGPSAINTRDFYIWSRSRPEMQLTLTPRVPAEMLDCIEIRPPVRLSAVEQPAFAAGMPDSIGLASVYKASIVIHERRNGKQLDLGPLEFVVKIESDEGKSLNVPVLGTVRGDIRLVKSDSSDRIDFGNSFPSSESRSAQVTVMADRPGLEVELDKASTSPEFLEVTLTPAAPRDGRNFWTLRVTIPPGKLYGALTDGFIVLKTKEENSRRVRIPIKANAYDGGRPF